VSDAVRAPAPWIAGLGAGLLVAGLAARLMMPEDLEPRAETLAIGLWTLGAGLTLIDAALRRRAPARTGMLLLPWLAIPPAIGAAAGGTKLAIDLFAAALGGFALRAIAIRDGAARGRRILAALLLSLAVFAVAQTVYLRADARAVAEATRHELTTTERGRAFLGSWRASASFQSPNALGGALLLLLPPLCGVCLAARGRARGIALAAALTAAGGFAAAGSAGAAASMSVAAAISGVVWTTPRTRARRLAVVAAVCVVVAVVAAVIVAAVDASASGKIATLRERLDYASTGRRMLRDALPFGFGLGGVAARAESYAWAGTAFSRSLHDWWLEGLVEAGIWFVPVAVAMLFTATVAMRRRPDETTSPAVATAKDVVPLVVGTILAVRLHPFVVFLPSRFDVGLWPDALLTGALVAASALVIARLPFDRPAAIRGWTLGVLAFLIHGLVDYDVAIAGVAAAFGAAFGLLPLSTPPSSTRAAVAATCALGLAGLSLPVWLCVAAA
jgi:hypothetical protein